MNHCPPQKNNKGFTLIELLVVIGILAILLSIVLIAINPARQFGQANDTQRRSNVTAILNSIGAYAADNNGTLPTGIPQDAAGPPIVPATPVDVGLIFTICDSILNTYISAIPTDPSLGIDAVTDCTPPGTATGYLVRQDVNNRVTVSAPNAEITTPIEITR